MKKLLMLFMLAAVAVACNNKRGTTATTEAEEDTSVFKYKEFTWADDAPHYESSLNIDFPVSGDEQLCEALFDYIRAQMEDYIGEVPETADMQDDGDAFVESYGKLSSENLHSGWEAYSDGDDSVESLYESASATITDTDDYVTCEFIYDCYFGGDGYSAVKGATFLKDDATKVDAKFLFNEPESDALLEVLHKALKKAYTGNEGFLEPEFIDEMTDFPDDYYITKDGIAFTFSQSAAAWFLLHGTIPLDDVSDLLTDEALGILGL